MRQQMPSEPELLRALRVAVVPVDEERREVLRDSTLSTIERAIRQGGARRQRRRRVVWVGVLAAAVLGGAASALLVPRTPTLPSELAVTSERIELRETQGIVVVARDGHATPVSNPAQESRLSLLEVGDQITTGRDGVARLVSPIAGTVQLRPGTDLRIDANAARHQRLALASGRVEIEVPTDGAPRTVSVLSPHAEVAVVGTAFLVEVIHSGSDPERTHVAVRHGVVRVTPHEGSTLLLQAGEEWWSSPPVRAVAKPAPEPATLVAAPGPRTSASQQGPKLVEPPTRLSTLAEENRLYRSALEARDGGDDGRARRLLDELLARYPESPLAGPARLERNRLQERTPTKP